MTGVQTCALPILSCYLANGTGESLLTVEPYSSICPGSLGLGPGPVGLPGLKLVLSAVQIDFSRHSYEVVVAACDVKLQEFLSVHEPAHLLQVNSIVSLVCAWSFSHLSLIHAPNAPHFWL